MSKPTDSLIQEMEQIQLAIRLIEFGARLQVLNAETDISRARLLRLYKEVRGESPPKGMLPSSDGWFVEWRNNIHASLFYNLYTRLVEAGCDRIGALVRAYQLYSDQIQLGEPEETGFIMDMTRAWTLIRFVECGILDVSSCTSCTGTYIVHAHSPPHDFVCGVCKPPSRAGRGRRLAA